MADDGRKDFSTKAKEEITPESTKSTQQKVKETLTDTKDRIARGLQPDESKSAGQETFDKVQRSSDRNAHGSSGEALGDKAKNAFGSNS